MQCSCGGVTETKFATKTHKKILIGYLEYEKCKSCGRTSDVSQFKRVNGSFEKVAEGPTGPHWDKL